MEVFSWLEMLGIAAFALSGAQVAIARANGCFWSFCSRDHYGTGWRNYAGWTDFESNASMPVSALDLGYCHGGLPADQYIPAARYP